MGYSSRKHYNGMRKMCQGQSIVTMRSIFHNIWREHLEKIDRFMTQVYLNYHNVYQNQTEGRLKNVQCILD